MMYGADGQLTNNKGKMTTEYTKNGKRGIQDELFAFKVVVQHPSTKQFIEEEQEESDWNGEDDY